MSTDSYFYLARQLAKCMMRSNMSVGPVRTQMTNTQKMNNYESSTQKMNNYRVYYLGDIKTKGINSDKILSHVCSTGDIKSKIVIVNACSSDKSESKIFHISINTSKVKDEIKETNNEEPFFTDNSVITATIYFKLFGCSKKILNKLDVTCERVCMETPK